MRRDATVSRTLKALLFMSMTGILAHGSEADKQAAMALLGLHETVGYISTTLLPAFEIAQTESADTQRQRLPLPLRLPFAQFVGAIRSIGSGSEEIIQKSYESLLVGAKDLTPPIGLGMYNYEGCYIAVAKSAVGPDVRNLFRDTHQITSGGFRLWTWSVGPAEGHPAPFTLYGSQVSQRYLLLAYSEESLVSTAIRLTALKRPPKNGLVLDTLLNHQYWIYRPIWSMETTAGRGGPQIDGRSSQISVSLGFSMDPQTKSSQLEIWSRNNGHIASTPAGVGNMLTLREVSPGIWRAEIPVNTQPQTASSFFQVMSLFGFGVVL